MPDPDADVVFEERQRLRLGWILKVITAVAALLVFLPVLWTYYCEPRSLLSVASGVLAIVGAAWAAAVAAFVGQIQVRVTRSMLLVKRGLVPRWSEWPLSDVARCRTIRYDSGRLIRPYDRVRGLGRHLRTYTTGGDQGVLVELRDGSYLLLGSAEPARLARALESVGVSTRTKPPPERTWAPALPARPDEVLPRPEPPAWEPTDEGGQPRESFLAVARAPLLYRDAERRNAAAAAAIFLAMVLLPTLALMYAGNVWEQIRSQWTNWAIIAAAVPFYVLVPAYILASRCWTRVTTLGCATWMRSYRRAWRPEEIASCRPIDAIDALRGDTVAGAVWAAPQVLLGLFAHWPAFGQPYRRLWAGGVMLTLRSAERVVLPRNDPDALCDALAQIGVQRRPLLSASDA